VTKHDAAFSALFQIQDDAMSHVDLPHFATFQQTNTSTIVDASPATRALHRCRRLPDAGHEKCPACFVYL